MDQKKDAFIFEKRNFILLGAAILLITLGFFMMSGGGSDDPSVFNPEIFNQQRLVFAPIVVLIGFALGIVSIMMKPKGEQSND